MSAKAAVVRRFPGAYAYSWRDCWTIYAGDIFGTPFASGKTAALAWKQSAKDCGIRGKRPATAGGRR